jgi:hypothetical protein
MIKKSFIKIIAYILVITGLFYNVLYAKQDTDIKEINKIDAYIVCGYYVGWITLLDFMDKRGLKPEDLKKEEDYIKFVTKLKDIFNNMYLIDSYYYVEYEIFLFDDISTVICKISKYYVYGKGINIEYVNEYYGIDYRDKLKFDGLENKDTEDKEAYNKIYKGIQKELNSLGIY